MTIDDKVTKFSVIAWSSISNINRLIGIDCYRLSLSSDHAGNSGFVFATTKLREIDVATANSSKSLPFNFHADRYLTILYRLLSGQIRPEKQQEFRMSSINFNPLI